VAGYDLSRGVDPSGSGINSLSAAWVMCFVRFKVLSTYSRAEGKSRSLDGSDVALERAPLVVTTDCTSVNVTASKGSHLKQLVATLAGEVDYLAEVVPGDWVLCWMLQDEGAAADLASRIRAGEQCNGWLDGLKFVGRVYSRRRHASVDGASGIRRVRYSVQGSGFAEFDSGVFWDPYLSISEPTINTWLGRLGVAVDKFLAEDGIDVNRAIPNLVELLFGSGIVQRAASPSGEDALQVVSGLTSGGDEAPYAYVVPPTVGALLGSTQRSKGTGVFAYADVLRALYGRQVYDQGTNGPPWGQFLPSGLEPMMGRFLPEPLQLSGKPVWSVLEQYLNPSVNEMYTCLRADFDGHVYPTLVVRQLPFSTGLLDADEKTTFLSLPRWSLPESLVFDSDLGSSDAMRFNFELLTGQAIAQAQPNIVTYARVNSPAIRDDQDIRRSGLRPDIATVAVGIYEQQRGPDKWMKLRADMLMGQHLALSGTISCVGIQEPIAEGDNIEYGGVVLHIESVTHTCSVTPDGKRGFMTTLQVSHGVRADPSTSKLLVDDDQIWAATSPGELDAGAPGQTYAGLDSPPGDPLDSTGFGSESGTGSVPGDFSAIVGLT
jgi:hypothetical protein